MSSKSGINDLAFNQNEDAMKLAIRKMEKRLEQIYEGGGKSKIEKEHRKGKMTARERISYLLDDPSDYLEIGAFAAYEMYEEHGGCPAAGVVVVLGKVSGRTCVIVANDATVKAGAWFPMTGKKT